MRLLIVIAALVPAFAEPGPGDVFREFTYTRRFSELDLNSKRPNIEAMRAGSRRDRAIEIPNIQGVTRAEVSVEYWGGHIGTTGQQFQVNDGPWLDIAQPQGAPGKPQCYYRTVLGRATTPVPVSSLKEGRNVFRFAAGPQACYGFDWGFYWVYSFTVRLYYEPGKPNGRILSPADGDEIGDHPRLIAEAGNDKVPVARVEFIGKYEDFNWEGDGVFHQWHYITQRGEVNRHIGTAITQPWAATWDTSWVPDQEQPVELMARITDAEGVISLTPAVKVRLRRQGRSVKMYKATDVPENFGVRVGRKKECRLDVPGDLAKARAARIVVSTWSAAHGDEIGLNGAKLAGPIGLVHNYSFDAIPVPVRSLKPGTNIFHIFSNTKEHALEVNWPGPVLLVEYGPPEVTPVTWEAPDFSRRIAIDVDPAGVERADAIAEVALDLPQHRGGLRLVESGRGSSPLAVQYGNGMLTFLVPGRTGAAETRRFQLYFDGPASTAASAGVTVADNVDCAGQPSFRVTTAAATYCYQKEGAGFASIVDKAGNEWLGYKPGGRSAGEFRGIPNLHNEFGHPGYQGESGSVTKLTASGPLKATLASEHRGGRWAARWDIYPGFARMTMLRHNKPYWFLYEGTPGGRLDLANGFQFTSDGTRRSLAESWSFDMPGPEWIYFGNPDSKQVLFVVNHHDDAAPDQYWPMEGNMTVFGFGRQFRCCGQYLAVSPAQFTIGLAPNGSFDAVRRSIESAWRDLRVSAGRIEQRP